jgi:hypothetical protein
MSETVENQAGSTALGSLGGALGEAGATSLAGQPEKLAEGLLRASLAHWEDAEKRSQLVTDLTAALTSDAGADRMRAFLSSQSSQLFREFGRALGSSDAMDLDHAAEVLNVSPLQINAAQAQVWGMVILRYIVRLEPIASASADELVALLAPTIQRYLAGPTD